MKFANAALAVSVSLMICGSAGCQESPRPAVAQVKPVDTKDLTIELGYGIPSCHIGMPINELSDEWQPEHEIYPDVGEPNNENEGSSYNLPKGIFCTYRKAKNIRGVVFCYRPSEHHDANNTPDYFNFRGKTPEGIEYSSTLEDVLLTYGEPDGISNTKHSETGERSIDLWYYQLGTSFTFSSGKLAVIAVMPKKTDPSYWKDSDIGDTAALRKLSRELSEKKRKKDKQK